MARHKMATRQTIVLTQVITQYCQGRGSVTKIIIISVRDDEAVYKEAEHRIQGLIKPIE